MGSNIILINATATKYGGALTILKGLLSEIKKTKSNSIYYVFCGVNLDEYISENIKIIKIKTGGVGFGGIKRIMWDLSGLFLYCKRNKLKPSLIISLQNTGVNFPKVKQLIYYHQPIPLFKRNWKIYRKDEAIFFFYKEIYPFFIRLLLNKNTEFVVQLKFIKNSFLAKFKVNDNKIHLIAPDVNLNFESPIEKINLNQEKLHIFYPTNLAKYKNIDILFKAISIIKEKCPDIFEKIILHITLDKNNLDINRKISLFQISNNINLIGNIPYKDVISYYNSVNLLVFPSYIESFGLPLVEAAHFGLPILAADLDYAHEVLENYSGVQYVKYDNAEMWANSIIENLMGNQTFDPFERNSINNSWEKFLQLTNKMINNV